MRINHEIYLKEAAERERGGRVCQLEGHICNLYGVQTNFAMLSQRGATAAAPMGTTGHWQHHQQRLHHQLCTNCTPDIFICCEGYQTRVPVRTLTLAPSLPPCPLCNMQKRGLTAETMFSFSAHFLRDPFHVWR